LNFASDNVTGASAEVLAAIVKANAGTEDSYGADAASARLTEVASRLFGCELAILPVTTGTAANALALSALVPPFGAVYCHETAHVMTDECGAPEFFSGGAKLLALPAPHGKLAPQQLTDAVAFARANGVHHVQPAAVTLSQATEWGTVYTQDEIGRLASTAHRLGLKVHMDGARFANAVARLGCTPAAATWQSGVDVLSLGATKNGALAAEAVVLFDRSLAAELEFRRKRSGHLWSKMRFLSAQLVAYLESDLWLRNARQSNAMAARLADGLATIATARVVEVVEANEVFVALPARVATALRAAGFSFLDWLAPAGASAPVFRLVTSYDTRPADVDSLLTAVRDAA
jgi:threonine aldolase